MSHRLPSPVETSGIEVRLGQQLTELLDPGLPTNLHRKVLPALARWSRQQGLPLPCVTFEVDPQLDPTGYQLGLHGEPCGGWELESNSVLAIGDPNALEKLIGLPTVEPIYQLPARWISTSQIEQALNEELTVMDAPSLVAAHLLEVLRQRQDGLLTLTSVEHLLKDCSQHWPTLVSTLKKDLGLAQLTRLLQELAGEGIPLAPFEPLLEACRLENPRSSLGSRICSPHLIMGALPALALEQRYDEVLLQELQSEDSRAVEHLFGALSALLSDCAAQDVHPVVITSATLRPQVRGLTRRMFPETAIIGWDEIPDELHVEILAEIGSAFHTASADYPRSNFVVG